MMSSCYSAYSATPGKVMPLDPIGRKTLQATGRSKTNKKIEISRRFLQSNCHDVQLLLRLLRYSRQSDALDPIGRKTFQATGRSKTNKKIDISRRFLQSNCLLHPVYY